MIDNDMYNYIYIYTHTVHVKYNARTHTHIYIYIYVNLQFNLMHTLDVPAVGIAPSVLPGDQLSDRDWIVAQGRRGGKAWSLAADSPNREV